MKSVFNKIEKYKPKEIVFPVLAEFIDKEQFVVLFLSQCEGIIVKGDQHIPIGEKSGLFISVDDKSTWRILSPEESIVLSNG